MPTDNQKESNQTWNALSLAWELGYTIAVPIVVFALLGRFLDKWLGTSPWLLLVGIFASLIASSIGVYFKAVKILKENSPSPPPSPIEGEGGKKVV